MVYSWSTRPFKSPTLMLLHQGEPLNVVINQLTVSLALADLPNLLVLALADPADLGRSFHLRTAQSVDPTR